MNGYRIITAPISVAEAQKLGQYLGQYEISVSNLTVRHLLADGRTVEDHPLAETIQDSAAAGGLGAATGSAIAPVAVVLGLAIPLWVLPGLVVAAIADIRAMYSLKKNMPHPDAVSSEIRFGLANVSAKRLSWTEYLLSVYAARQGWHIEGLRDERQRAMGARYAAAHGGYPTPWRNRNKGKGRGLLRDLWD